MGHLIELGEIAPAQLAHRLRIVREIGRLQPAAQQLPAERLPLLRAAIADRQTPILDREVVLADAVGLTQDQRIGVDAELARHAGHALPARRVQLDQGVIEVEGDEVDRSIAGESTHSERVARSGAPYQHGANHRNCEGPGLPS